MLTEHDYVRMLEQHAILPTDNDSVSGGPMPNAVKRAAAGALHRLEHAAIGIAPLALANPVAAALAALHIKATGARYEVTMLAMHIGIAGALGLPPAKLAMQLASTLLMHYQSELIAVDSVTSLPSVRPKPPETDS